MRLEIDSPSTLFPLANHEIAGSDFALSSYDFGSLLKKGIAAAQGGERDHARKLLSQATAINPANEDAWMWLASISDYPEELLAFLNRVLEINPANGKAAEWRTATNALLAKTFVQRALGARNDGRFDHASQCLDQALACDNQCESAWYWKASLTDLEDERLELFEHVLTINPNNSDAADAISMIRESQVSARLHEARMSLETNRQHSVEILSPLVNHDSEEVRESAWMLMAQAAEDDDHRMACYARVLEVNPENREAADASDEITKARSRAVFASAKAAAASGDRREALSILDGFVQNTPGSADAWLLKSHLSEALSDKVNALEKALAIDPSNVAARSGLEFLSLTFGADVEPVSAVPVEREPEAAYELTEEASPTVVETADKADHHEYEPAFTETTAEVDPIIEFATRTTEESFRFDEPVSFESQSVSLESQPVSFDSQPFDDEDMTAVPMTVSTDDEQESEFAELAGDFFAMSDVDRETETVVGRRATPTLEMDADSFGLMPDSNPFEPEMAASPFDSRVEADESPRMFEEVFAASAHGCAFCGAANDAQAFECGSCRSTLTLSDLEQLLRGSNADQELVQHAVTSMEAEWNLREFSENELTWLGLGHLNLGNLENGLRYLQEASRLNPNNVILTGQVNTIAIRTAEIRRQKETYEAIPKGKTILVVDDSATVRKLIAGKLEKSGHNVICAVDGVEALARIEEQMPDLVLLDITMPRLDGYEVCKQIRANPLGKDVPVVMISGKDGFFDKVRGRMAGTTGYVTKPFGPETLMKALETYLISEAVVISEAVEAA